MEEKKKDPDGSRVIGVPLSDLTDQVLVTPMNDFRPSGPTMKEYRLYRKDQRGKRLLEEMRRSEPAE